MVFKLPKPKRRVNEKMTLEALHKSAETYREMYDDIRKKNDILQKQLDIAVAGLQYYANEDIYIESHKIVNGNNEWTSEVALDNGVKASYFLKRIEELNNAEKN